MPPKTSSTMLPPPLPKENHVSTTSFDQLVANLALAKKTHTKCKADADAKLTAFNAALAARGVSLQHTISLNRPGRPLPPPTPTPKELDLNILAKDLSDSMQSHAKAFAMLTAAQDAHRKALLDAGAV